VKSETVKKLQAGRARKARETGLPCGGRAGYGKRGFGGEIAVMEDIKMYRDQGFTLKEISREMNLIGYPTPARSPHGWTKSTVHAIIKANEPFFSKQK
jgi:hypothetical protein